jgi:hypothetical protein
MAGVGVGCGHRRHQDHPALTSCAAIGRADGEGYAPLLPVQIVRHGAVDPLRLLGYNHWLADFFRAWEALRALHVT